MADPSQNKKTRKVANSIYCRKLKNITSQVIGEKFMGKEQQE
jgi:hypothetical protein